MTEHITGVLPTKRHGTRLYQHYVITVGNGKPEAIFCWCDHPTEDIPFIDCPVASRWVLVRA